MTDAKENPQPEVTASSPMSSVDSSSSSASGSLSILRDEVRHRVFGVACAASPHRGEVVSRLFVEDGSHVLSSAKPRLVLGSWQPVLRGKHW